MRGYPHAGPELVAVTAEDYDEALAFYRDVLGLRERAAFTPRTARTILEAGRDARAARPHARYVDQVEVGAASQASGSRSRSTTPRRHAACGRRDRSPTTDPWNSLNARLEAPPLQ